LQRLTLSGTLAKQLGASTEGGNLMRQLPDYRVALQAVVLAGLLALVGLVGAAAQQANAAFPGKNGRIVFSSTRTGNLDIYSMNPDGSGVARLTNSPESDSQPAVSPDGNKIAFTSNRDQDVPDDFDIYVMNADGSEETQRTDRPADEVEPAFAPDGEGILYVSDIGFGDNDIWLLASENDHRLLTEENLNPDDPVQADDDHPASTPTANRIAFESDRAGNDNIHTQPLYLSNGLRITDNLSDERDPNWSPDGKRIVFVSRRRKRPESIFIMGASGANQQRLTNDAPDPLPQQDVTPAFSPNGARVVFSSNRGGLLDIYSMNTDGKEVTRLTSSSGNNSNPDWGRPPCTITGTNGNDVLNGTSTADVICGLSGEDRLRGLEGNDEVRGGGGNDIVYGGPGADLVLGELGVDFVNTKDTVEGNDHADGGGGIFDSCRTDPEDVRVNCELP
jgi:dipeptidyl aminopeptidase/acylaminoacyl peptidase